MASNISSLWSQLYTNAPAITVTFGAVFAILIFSKVYTNRNPPLPPSPSGIPILGHALDLNVKAPWETFNKWSQVYGDVMTIRVLGKRMIILNSAEATMDLLDKRSAKYSDRPDMPMLKDLMGWTWTFALMGYGARWRQYRKTFVHHFREPGQYRHIQLEFVHDLVQRFSKSPEDFYHHLRHYTGAIILKRVYGYTVLSKNDPYVTLVDKATEGAALATKPPGFLVDLFPSLKHVPAWFPGAGFKRKAEEWKKLSDDMVEAPYNMTKEKFLKGKSETCFVSSCLEDQLNPTARTENLGDELIKHTAAVAYAAGVDTTASSLTTFIFAMVMHPEVQRQAQAELETVLLGHNRLPVFEDRDSLPYITAIMKESLRWLPVLPLSVPHRSVEEDLYKGYWIPSGTTILPNTWAILHNPEVYKNPSEFKPSRFIEDPSLPDPFQTFGYGRRSCAGRDMALDALWLAIANLLYAFDFKKVVDDKGREVDPVRALSPGSLCFLLPFLCTITPRSGKESLILE